MATAAEELELLERVFLRIGSTENDEQLENIVNKFLIPVLWKLSSSNEGVRKKVMELLFHINKRVKRSPTIQLPVDDLLNQFKSQEASTFIINFSILYIRIGFPRLTIEQQAELVPTVLNAIPGRPKQLQDSLLLLIMPALSHVKVPSDKTEIAAKFSFLSNAEIVKQLSLFMLDVLILPYGFTAWEGASTGSSTDAATMQVPAGMSEYSYKRVINADTPLLSEQIENIKVGVIKFISSGLFSDNEIICHLIVGAADSRFSVANIADTELKRIVPAVDWSSVYVAQRLYLIYLGTSVLLNDKSKQPANNEHKRLAANTRVRLKLITYLSKLHGDAILFPSCLQIIFDSLYGVNTNPKLKILVLNFAAEIVRKADMNTLKKMGGMLYTGLLKVIWNVEENVQLKTVSYTVIGQLIQRLPTIVNKNLTELELFFEQLTTSNSHDLKTAVMTSLLQMLPAFKSAPFDKQQMMNLLTKQIESEEKLARLVAVRYLARVTEQTDLQARWLLLFSTGDSDTNVKSSAVTLLLTQDVANENDGEMSLPEFDVMCTTVVDKLKETLKNGKFTTSLGTVVIPLNIDANNQIHVYLRHCLARSAGVKQTELLTHPCQQTPYIGRYLNKLYKNKPDVVHSYLDQLDSYLKVTTQSSALECLLEVVGSCPQLFADRYKDKVTSFQGLLGSTNELIRTNSAKILGVVCSWLYPGQQLEEFVMEMLNNLNKKPVELQHGVLLTVGHVLERRRHVTDVTDDNFITSQVHKSIVMLLVELLNHQQPLVVSAACFALGNIGRCAPLPLPIDNSNSDTHTETKLTLLQKLFQVVKNQTSAKIKEKAVLTCGHLCLGDQFIQAKEIVKWFLDYSKEVKDVEIHMTIGEAIVLCCEGRGSSETRDMWSVLPEEHRMDDSLINKHVIDWFVSEIINITHDCSPNLKQAVCIFLLSLVKHDICYLQHCLPSVQSVFMDCLSHNNEIVQDVASKGLGYVYEKSNEEDKKKLVNGLLDQLLSGKRQVQQVTNDTKLFEEGQLGSAPSGGNLSTYKELCSLASDLNQPDLIYTFMNLANHNAIWNSKKGAAFGFQTIVQQANEELNDYLPKIVPRLYRYQFDPTPKIQHSMKNIWQAIIKDTQKTIDKFYNEILQDLLHNLTSHQWRVRMSCCLALQDFFRTGGNRGLKDAKAVLGDLWKSLFRVMDDVHEGTRLTAQNTAKTLSKMCVRSCDPEQGKVDDEMLRSITDVFLNGITNQASEVRSLCLLTISQLVNSAGETLKPNLTTLIPTLLEAAGELESVGLSYLSAQFGGQSQTQEMIDSVRADVAKSHYSTQTVQKCVRYVEVEMLDVLIPRVVEIMKSVNLGSRVASAHFIVLLARHLNKDLQPYIGKLFPPLVQGLLDRNSTIRKTYASTIGQIIDIAKPSTLERLFAKLNSWYFEREDASSRSAICQCLQSIGQYNSEVVKNYNNIVVPLVFFATNQQKTPDGKDEAEQWDDVWNDLTSGTEVTIRQYLTNICDVIETAIDSPSWNMKTEGARCITTVCNKLGTNIPESEVLIRLTNILLRSIPGKTFKGKEELLIALAKLSSAGKTSLTKEQDAIVDLLLNEAKKKIDDIEYKRHVFVALGNVLHTFDGLDKFEEVYLLVQSQLAKLEQKADSDEEMNSSDLSKLRDDKFKMTEVVYETLGKAWPSNKLTQVKYQDKLLQDCCDNLELSPRNIQTVILSTLRYYIDKLYLFDDNGAESDASERQLQEILDKITSTLLYALGITKHSRLRKEALNIVYLVIQKLKNTNRTVLLNRLSSKLSSVLLELEKDPTPECRTRLLDIKSLLKDCKT